MAATSYTPQKAELTKEQLRASLDEQIERYEIHRDKLIDTVGVWGPLAIPLVPAGLTFAAIGVNYNRLLHFPALASWPIGAVAGMGVEVFGIIANENYLDMQRYNQTLAEGEERAPVEEARRARNTYVAIVAGLMLIFGFLPALALLFVAPICVGVIVYDLFTVPAYLISGIVVSLMTAYLGYAYWDKFKGLFERK